MKGLFFWFAVSLVVGITSLSAAEIKKPNVVFILADDLGYTDLAVYGSKYYETPNLDKMAARGLKMTYGYTCGPNCQPTRAALMSGQYGPRTGIYTVGNIDRFNWQSRTLRPVDNLVALPLEKVTLAQAMQKGGYVTGMFGKWHLGDGPKHHPSQRGFNEAIVSAGKHFDFKTDPKTPYAEGTYLADFLTDNAEAFIRKHKDESFFLYVPHYGVHAPHDAKESLIAKFKDKPAAGGHHDPAYAAMIASVDESVGRIIKALEDNGLAENTLVIFSSDNGGVGGYEREGIKKGGDITDNAPLKGGKGMLSEGGVRVPYLFYWPGHIKGGRVSDIPVNSVDLYPTLLEMAGGTPEAGYPLDGKSYRNLLLEQEDAGAGLKERALYWHFPGYLGAGQNTWRTLPVSVIHEGDWKLMEYLEDGRHELYNLKEDVSEQTNLAEKEADKVKTLLAKLNAWRADVKAPMPTANTPSTDAANADKPKKGKGKGKKKAAAEKED